MPAKKKYRRLTNKEKQMRKQIRAELREDGIIPPVKPRLNRKKFIEETSAEFKESIKTLWDMKYLIEAISWMQPYEKITLEHIGIFKVLKIATILKKYEDEIKDNRKRKYSLDEIEKRIRVIRGL